MSDDVRYVTANGLSFAYLEAGTGPLALLLHGFPDTARSWDDARARVAAKGYRAVSPWLRGYAPTAIPDRDADMETIGRDVLALIEALGEDKATVIAHDWGAAAAYVAAALDPARVQKLVVVGTPHPATMAPTPARAWRYRHFFFYKLAGAPTRFAKNDFAALPRIVKRWSPRWEPDARELAPVRETFADPASLDAAFGYYRQLGLRPPACLRTPIAVPTLVFAGLDDPMASPRDYHKAKRMFTADYVVEEMRGGHFMHREHPTDFIAKLLAHL